MCPPHPPPWMLRIGRKEGGEEEGEEKKGDGGERWPPFIPLNASEFTPPTKLRMAPAPEFGSLSTSSSRILNTAGWF